MTAEEERSGKMVEQWKHRSYRRKNGVVPRVAGTFHRDLRSKKAKQKRTGKRNRIFATARLLLRELGHKGHIPQKKNNTIRQREKISEKTTYLGKYGEEKKLYQHSPRYKAGAAGEYHLS